ncbi:ABC transporter permease subunit [Bowmanella sp. Y26]|uniref:ABC transporter permease subunit n=1 Tax=Bowmanella yangjiangensis TaxID=2811230 RepID=UPI001BDC717C|nr:ABC transporter permease subunit [Bowmanella yangjiangensis]MBT1062743.1 ABC transporter permease subunit [Bowmanella yangjiangensis]
MSPAQRSNGCIVQTDYPNPSSSLRRRRTRDRLAARIITIGGWTVLATLAMLIWHLLYVTIPLLQSPSLQPGAVWQLPQEQVLLLEDLQQERALITRAADCQLGFFQVQPNHGAGLTPLKHVPISCQTQVKAKHHLGGRYLFMLGADGMLRVERLTRVGGQVLREPQMSLFIPDLPTTLNAEQWQVALSDDWLGLAVQSAGKWRVYWASRQMPTQLSQLELPLSGMPTLLPSIRTAVQVGHQQLLFTDMSSSFTAKLNQPAATILAFPGSKAFLLNYADGRIEKWSAFNDGGHFRFRPIYALEEHLAISQLQMAQGKDLGMLLGAQGQLWLFLSSTGETILRTKVATDAQGMWLVNERLYVWGPQSVQQWQVDNISSIISFERLWQKVWYEGYAEPAYVWQSSAAEDVSQAKYSLVPLVIGSLKAAILALIIAIPLAVGAAIYTAYFVPARLRNWLKPGIELLEAVPSVVIGFIAAIWLIPIVEDYLLGMLMFLLLLPVSLFALAMLQQPLSRGLSIRWQSGWELLLLVPVVLLLAWGAFVLGGEVQSWLWPDGWFPGQDNHSSKNALVVALALGIAIVPSIYSLAEDAIFEVPGHLRQASFALGATRAQTLRRVVLVAAYPGIFSSIILGLSRAFGETMIVLMVTGNTPVADWDIFAGMRSLTANIAIELPESEVNSIHYRVLFFTALLLFGFTFVINTLAELVRGRLRKHYQSV